MTDKPRPTVTELIRVKFENKTFAPPPPQKTKAYLVVAETLMERPGVWAQIHLSVASSLSKVEGVEVTRRTIQELRNGIAVKHQVAWARYNNGARS